jgi:hypothetical protein
MAIIVSIINAISIAPRPFGEENADDTNPFLYGCTSDSQCNNTMHRCDTDKGADSVYWFCFCWIIGDSCNMNADCCSNVCNSGVCGGDGTQGCFCDPKDSVTYQGCAAGFVCHPWGTGGYCDDGAQTTKEDTSVATTAPPSDVCSNHGNYTCNCFHGYTGPNCENQIDFCNELVIDYTGAPIRAGDLCNHGTCVTSVLGASCTCNPGFTGQFCQDEIADETAITSRCSMYSTNSTIEQNVPIGCPEQQVCIPDHLTCAIEHACEEPFGWCIPFSGSTSNMFNAIQLVASNSKHISW